LLIYISILRHENVFSGVSSAFAIEHVVHRRQNVEKVRGAEHCYLRGLGLSLSEGMPPGKFLKNIARRLNLGAFEAKNRAIIIYLFPVTARINF